MLDASLLRFRPSEIAAASMILSSSQLKKTSGWTESIVKFTGYTEQDLKEVVEEVKSFALEINPKFISTLRYKFSKTEYMKVANYQFTFDTKEDEGKRSPSMEAAEKAKNKTKWA